MLPREVDPLVHNMSTESPGDIKYSEIGGLAEQIRELREVRNIFKWRLYVFAYKYNVVVRCIIVGVNKYTEEVEYVVPHLF